MPSCWSPLGTPATCPPPRYVKHMFSGRGRLAACTQVSYYLSIKVAIGFAALTAPTNERCWAYTGDLMIGEYPGQNVL